jgi:hypothetical protein
VSSGAHWARAFMWWQALEPSPGVLDEAALEQYRQVADALTARGVRVVWVIVGAPAWASMNGTAGGPPADPSVYAAFVGAVAARMGASVSAYEIWNEEDLARFWGAPPDPVRYAQILAATYPVVKAANPGALVLFGGLTGNDYHYLQRAYDAGAGGFFDAVAVHTDIPCELRRPGLFVRDPGGQISRWSFLGYRSVRATMLAHGDDKPIWMTELGWAVSDALCPIGVWAGLKRTGVSEGTQAADLADAFACLAADRYVTAGLWFAMRDYPGDALNAVQSGLLRADGSPRPALQTFGRVAGGAGLGACREHYVGPRVRVRVRRDSRTGALIVTARIHSDLALARVTIRVDGRVVLRRHGSTPRVMTRVGPRRSSGRRHTVSVAAVDTARNGGRATVIVGGRPR